VLGLGVQAGSATEALAAWAKTWRANVI